MAGTVYLAQLNGRAAITKREGESFPGHPIIRYQELFAFSDKSDAQDFCRRQTHIDGAEPWHDGPMRFCTVDPDTRLAKEAWITEIPLDPTPALPGMEGV